LFQLFILQDVDATKRPGAGLDGYASLKKHPFFRGIDWKNIRKTRAPNLAAEANVFYLKYVHATIAILNLFMQQLNSSPF
jgi:capsule polysaccharide modification protein KpsS